MDKDKIEMKTLMQSAAVAEYLTQLAKGFKSGVIVVEKDGESLALTTGESAEVEIEARMKKDKARFSLEVTWRTAPTQDESANLKISAEAPKAAKPGKPDKPDKKDEECKDCKPGEKKQEKPGEKKDDKKPAAVAAPAKPAAPAVAIVSVTPSGATPPVLSVGVDSKTAPK
ncbi:MAG: amphi-Trp domain-containing protein [Humidesulfovibrio sp.]|nr:amphi-Trp domain-containing protein [Humidesulfovibrio sp.]